MYIIYIFFVVCNSFKIYSLCLFLQNRYLPILFVIPETRRCLFVGCSHNG